MRSGTRIFLQHLAWMAATESVNCVLIIPSIWAAIRFESNWWWSWFMQGLTHVCEPLYLLISNKDVHLTTIARSLQGHWDCSAFLHLRTNNFSKHFPNPLESHTASCLRTNIQTLHLNPPQLLQKREFPSNPIEGHPKASKYQQRKRQPVSIHFSSISLLQNPSQRDPHSFQKLAFSFLNTAFPPTKHSCSLLHFQKSSLSCKISAQQNPERDPHNFQKNNSPFFLT